MEDVPSNHEEKQVEKHHPMMSKLKAVNSNHFHFHFYFLSDLFFYYSILELGLGLE